MYTGGMVSSVRTDKVPGKICEDILGAIWHRG